MNNIAPQQVLGFLLNHYSERIRGMGLDPATLPASFDLMLSGIIDSWGILEMISALEEEFETVLDITQLSAEQMTVLGPLAEFVAAQTEAKTSDQDAPPMPD